MDVYRIYLETGETLLRDAKSMQDAIDQGSRYLDEQGKRPEVCVDKVVQLCPLELDENYTPCWD